MILDNNTDNSMGEKVFSVSGTETTGHLCCRNHKKKSLQPCSSYRILKEDTKAKTIREKMINWNYSKLKIYPEKDNSKKIKRHYTNWEKFLEQTY